MLRRFWVIAVVALACSCGGAMGDLDGGNEADAGSDAGQDAGLDAGRDAGADAGADAGIDAGPYDAGVSSDHQRARTLGSTDAGNGFYEYLPPHYEDLQPRPLLVFWHGIGENGNGTTQLNK